MLRALRIENFVLARNVRLEFESDLNLITGETGAGKSLIVDAVAVALGGRAESSFVRQGEDRALVEVLFDLSERPDVVERLRQAGYEALDGELLVRREIGADGRSRNFLGGATVTVALLRELTAGLVELHGQHEPQTLFQPELHRALLDRFGDHETLLADVRREALALREIDQRRRELEARARTREARTEILRFRLAELEQVDPQASEEEDLRRERDVLRHAEEIAEALAATLDLVYEGEGAALDRIHAAGRRMRAQQAHGELYGELADRLDDVRAQVEDVATDARAALEELSADPGRLEEIEERLLALERLRRRFEGASLAEIVAGAVAMRRELDELAGQAESAAELAAERERRAGAYAEAAQRLTEARGRAAEKLDRAVSRLLGELAMKSARLETAIDTRTAADAVPTEGLDQVEFLLQANPGEPARPLRKVASGGELSRVMLALDLALERGLPRRTLVFDEVDQGLGGEAAERLGEFLAQASRRHQVVCITHLPQVAAQNGRHVHVTKKQRSGRTVAVVRVLEDEDERADELARMLGGSIVTDTARRHAEEMLRAAAGGREEAR
jgi:DNA repair protein RecN (Recombination protein N)